jgi:hypothetical protein
VGEGLDGAGGVGRVGLPSAWKLSSLVVVEGYKSSRSGEDKIG